MKATNIAYAGATLVFMGVFGTFLSPDQALSQQITAPKSNSAASLGTVITNKNGIIEITGGTRATPGLKNLFHRFNEFNTTNPSIKSVRFLADQGIQNVFASILSRAVLNKPISIAKAGGGSVNLYMLSPYGISINKGTSFVGINTLLLSTARRFQLGTSYFDVFDTLSSELTVNQVANQSFDTYPEQGIAQILAINLQESQNSGSGFFPESSLDSSAASQFVSISIEAGVSLEVNKSLLIVSNQAPITIGASTLSAKGSEAGTLLDLNKPADGIAIVSQDIAMTGTTLLTNSQFLIREPYASLGPTAGTLASPIVGSFKFSAGPNGEPSYVQDPARQDTYSRAVLKDVTISTASNTAATEWGGLINLLGFGNRNCAASDGCSAAVVAPNPSDPIASTLPTPANGARLQVDISDETRSEYFGGYSPFAVNSLNPASVTPTGRLAYRGLRIDGLTIRPLSPSITRFSVGIGNDWGFAKDLVVDTRSLSGLTSRQFRFVQGYKSGSSIGASDGGAELTTPADWTTGKIGNVANPANAYVAYVARWWDGGDVTNNNISISFLTDPGPSTPKPPANLGRPNTPNPPANPGNPSSPKPPANPGSPSTPKSSTNPISPGTTKTSTVEPGPTIFNSLNVDSPNNEKTSFDQVLFNFDQTVFSDADVTSGLNRPSISQGSSILPEGVTLKISLESPAALYDDGDEKSPPPPREQVQ